MDIIRNEIDRSLCKIKVREDEDDIKVYLFPETVAKRTVEILKASDIFCESRPADVAVTLPMMAPLLAESRFDVSELDESECVALDCFIEITDLCDLIDYVNSHEDERIRVEYFRKSELPEYQILLNEETEKTYTPEIKEALREYMRTLLDLNDGERYTKICSFQEEADFAKLLDFYSPNIQEFLKDHVTKRFQSEFL